MVLRKIKLVNFRNYGEQDLNFSSNFNFIHGNNGHGKTNILEAISFLSYGKSFLNSPEQDCVRFGQSEFYIDAEYLNDIGNRVNLSLSYNSYTRKKTFLVNKEKPANFSFDVFGKFPVVFLTPHSLDITYGNPSERRRFFDILIAQTNRLYFDYLKELTRILKQKNALLKSNIINRKYSIADFGDLLNSYNEKLCEVSANLLSRRLNFLSEFRNYFERNFGYLSSRDDKPIINYKSSIFDTNETEDLNKYSEAEIGKRYTSYLEEVRSEEISRGVSLAGPHRDDYVFGLKKRDNGSGETYFRFEMKNFASQGEHKTFVVALKLAEYYYIKDKLDSAPVLILDDVLSELDSDRVFMVISRLKDFGQIFLTTTDYRYLDNISEISGKENISVFEVNNGSVN